MHTYDAQDFYYQSFEFHNVWNDNSIQKAFHFSYTRTCSSRLHVLYQNASEGDKTGVDKDVHLHYGFSFIIYRLRIKPEKRRAPGKYKNLAQVSKANRKQHYLVHFRCHMILE